jgi:hypothetical protein
MSETMKKLYYLFLSSILLLIVLSGCSKKGEAITELKVGSYNFTTFTIDTLRLKVVVNDQVLGDSLLTPVGSLRSNITFLDTVGTFKLFNADNGQLYIDTTIKLKIGFSTISIIQLNSGQIPFIVPLPNEPAPAPGNFKVRFQYIQPSNSSVPFFDSVQCVIRLSGTLLDTIILNKYQTSEFYEAPLGSSFSMKVIDPSNGQVIDNTTTTLNSSGFSDFNTAALFGTAPGGVAYNFTLQRIY